jgi:hypothetical protein
VATFTTTQAAQVRMYLGYPDLFRYENPRLESILQGDELSADALTIIANLLAQLNGLDGLLGGTGTLVGQAAETAGVQKADEVTLYKGQTIADLRKLGRQAASRISNMLGVPFYGDPWGEGGYPGDTYSAGGLGPANGGNVIPLG